MQAEQLHDQGWHVLDAHWTICPESWPVHVAAVRGIESFGHYLKWATDRFRRLRPILGILWPELGIPDVQDRNKLTRFITELAPKAAAFKPENAHYPNNMPRGIPGFYTVGRKFSLELAGRASKIEVLPERCSGCGICVKLCPAGCFTREHEDQVPVYGPGCTGCWSCYQHCPEKAIAGYLTKPGVGKYPGPTRELKELFKL